MGGTSPTQLRNGRNACRPRMDVSNSNSNFRFTERLEVYEEDWGPERRSWRRGSRGRRGKLVNEGEERL